MGKSIRRNSDLSSDGKSSATPSTVSVMTSLMLPTQPPASAFGAFVWRCRMWFESTFVFTMLEPWEKVLCASVIMTLFLLVGTGLVRYFPPHVKTMYDRATYYWFGDISVLANGSSAGF